MKKSLALALAILLALSLLTACGGNPNTPGGNNNTPGNNGGGNPTSNGSTNSGCNEHDFDLTWVQSETHHWQQCKNCDAKSDHDAHTGNPCEICSYVNIGDIGGDVDIPYDGSSVSGDKYDTGWKENEFTRLLPNPASVLSGIRLSGISEDDEKKYEVIYQDVSAEQFAKYVQIVKDEGFDVDVEFDLTQLYTAKNADGYTVELTHTSYYMEVALRKK